MTRSTVNAITLKMLNNAEVKVNQKAVESINPSLRPFEWDAPKMERQRRSNRIATQRHTIHASVNPYTLIPVIRMTSEMLARVLNNRATAWPAIKSAGSALDMFCAEPFEELPLSTYQSSVRPGIAKRTAAL